MRTYQIEICETLCRVVEVEAESTDEAISIVITKYRQSEIVLDSNDFLDYNVMAL